VEDGRSVEAAARQLDRTGARVTGWSGSGGARGCADCRRGGGMEEPATLGCSWTRVAGGRTSQGGGRRVPTGGRVPTLDDGAATTIDLSEWAWTWGQAGLT
jgi:hypothetical protein